MTPIQLPLPPTANTMWRRVGNKTLLSKKYREWRTAAGRSLNIQCVPVYCGPVMVDITCKRPRKNCDIDNRIKPILDLLQSAYVIENDSFVHEVRARWGDVEGAEVTITEMLRP